MGNTASASRHRSEEPRAVEDIYPLTPLQQGLLFHDLYDRDTGMYVEQLSCTLQGELDPAAFAEAWQRVVDAHPALRTAFVWEGQEEPIQVVRGRVEMPLDFEDWRGLAPEEQDARWKDCLAADRNTGFQLDRAPLMRLILRRRSANRYGFAWTHHHLLIDGWCLSLVLADVFACYEALCRGQSFHPEPRRPFRDYLAWLAGQDRAAAERYWRERLAGFAAATPLGVDSAGGSDPAHGEEIRRLSPALSARLTEFARSHRLTLNTLVQGAWALLLSRYGNTEDVLYGVTVAGRPAELAGAEEIVGLFINTLPLRIRANPAAEVLDWLRDLMALTAGMSRYEYMPLVEAQRCSLVPPGQPLFESLVVFENYPLDRSLEERAGSLAVGDVEFVERTHYPLTLIVRARDELELRLGYQCGRIQPAAAARVLEHLEGLLESLAAASGQRIGDLALLGAEERQLVLTTWNATAAPFPGEAALHRLFEAQADRTPDAVAVVFEDQTLTYRELEVRANRLAHHLQAHGVGTDMTVGIAMERSLELVVGLFGILKAGGAYVPVDPDYPAERIAFLLRDARVPVLLTQERLLERLPAVDAAVICLDRDRPAIDARPAPPPRAGFRPDQLAYVIYTSGSTGLPKGAGISHRSIVNRLWWMQETYRLGMDDRILQKTPFSFDVSVWEFFWPLLVGARLVVAPPGAHRDGLALVDLIRRHGITGLHFVPSMLQGFLDAPEVDSCLSLRQVFCSGEALSGHLRDRFFRHLPALLHNLYGPTEAAVDVTAWTCGRNDREPMVPIGRPIANTRIYLLDRRLDPVPVGVPGELYIGGVGLARGYRNRPDLTAERFVPNPFAELEAGGTPDTERFSARLYRTGDLARRRPDGVIEFLGRTDHQVKIRGFRIEPGEIEAQLLRHPGVAEAAVIARREGTKEPRLVAYVVPDPLAAEGEIPTSGSLAAFLGRTLPDYMVPAAYVILDKLPLTPNGKLDRQALPAPELPSVPGAEPRDATEATLAGLWAEALEIERVGIHDNFFALGGDSILAIRVVSRMREAGWEITPREIFQYPTVAELAAIVSRAAALPPAPEVPETFPLPEGLAAARGGIEDAYPLTPLQQGFLFHSLYDPEAGAYTEQASCLLLGALDPDRFRQAWQAVLDHHAVLRASVAWEGVPEPLLVIHQGTAVRLDLLDWSAQTAGGQARLRREYLAADKKRGFDLGQPPLMRLTLARLADRRYWFLWTHHHVLLDGWCLPLIVKDALAAYRQLGEGRIPAFAAYPPFRDYSVWLRAQDKEPAQTYWRKTLAGFAGATALGLAPPAADGRTGYEVHALRFEERETTALESRARSLGVTLNTLMQGAWAFVLSRCTNAREVLFGVTVSGRPAALPEVDKIVGAFINTLPLRVELDPAAKVEDFLRAILARNAEMRAYEYLPLPEILAEAGLSGGNPFESLLVFENFPLHAWDFDAAGEIGVRDLVVGQESNYPLNLVVLPGSQLAVNFSYDTARLGDEAVARLARHLHGVLLGMEAGKDLPLARLPLLGEEELRQVLVNWNGADAGVPADGWLHRDFEARAAESPDAPAAVCGMDRLSYGELNTRANRLAHYLRRRGIGPESRVGLCLDRSLDLAVGILGILKAGGAYVPIDPAYPRERVEFMIEDARLALLVSRSDLAAVLPVETAALVRLDREAGAIALEAADNPPPTAGPGHLAYVIYTSGSTGRPKGVAITHRNAVYSTRARFHIYGEPVRRFLLLSPAAFDSSVAGLFWTLSQGGELCLPPEGEHKDPTVLRQLIADRRISHLLCLPSLYGLLLDLGAMPESLRCVIVAGEACPAELAGRHSAGAPAARLFNEYGPTEGTVWSSVYPVQPEDAGRAVPIGRPIGDTRIYLLNGRFEPVPIGAAGEIHVAGPGLARGYLGRPDLTAERFVPDPFGAPGGRLYRTGDLGRYREDGQIEFLGRIDHQVKLRGYRIEPGEIEAVLARHPDVRDVSVIVRPEQGGCLVAYAIARPERAPAVAGRERHLLPNGLAIAQYRKNETDYLYREIFEERDYLHQGITLAEGDCVFDVGANIGMFSLFVLHHWPEARVYAFEPMPEPYRCLEANLKLYGRDAVAVQGGLSNRRETAAFTFYPEASLMSGRYADDRAERQLLETYIHNQNPAAGAEAVDSLLADRFRGETVSVTLRTLSDAMREYGVERIDLLKVDVERCELEVLEGIADGDFAKIRQIVMEVEDSGGRLARVSALLEGRGYRIAVEQDPLLRGSNVHTLYARRPDETHRPAEFPQPARPRPLLAADELREFAAASLPEYMVPSAIVFLEEFPLTPNGKLDRAALPPPDRGPVTEPRRDEADPLVESLAGTLAEVLGVERIGPHDDFFDRGGHSLLAIQAIVRIQEKLGIELPMVALFEAPTPARLAPLVAERMAARNGEMADWLEAIENLPDHEVERLLAEAQAGDRT